jgi:hypothetical protein
MGDLLTWLQDYSPLVVILLAVGAAFLYVAKIVVEKTVTARLDAYAEESRLRLGRRSGFEEKILTDRYVAFTDLFMRMQRITTTVNRKHHGEPVPEGFRVGDDIVPLTEIYEELSVRETLLGPRLHSSLAEAAQAALEMSRADSAGNWPEAVSGWLRARKELQAAAEEEFGLSTIRW